MVTNSPGVAVLGKWLESREFPQGEHPLLCKRKLNYVIMGPSCFAHEMNIHLSFTEEVQYLSSAVPELTKGLYEKRVQQSSIKTH